MNREGSEDTCLLQVSTVLGQTAPLHTLVLVAVALTCVVLGVFGLDGSIALPTLGVLGASVVLHHAVWSVVDVLHGK